MSGDDGQSAADDSRVETVVASTDRRTLAAEQSATRPTQRSMAIALAVWGLGYACYRAYYAAGGEVGMRGDPHTSAPSSTWPNDSLDNTSVY